MAPELKGMLEMKIGHAFLLAVLAFAGLQPQAKAQTIIDLGWAKYFALLADSTVTNTGNTIVYGDLGVSPSTAITGFPSGIVHGTIHPGDVTAAQALASLVVAYNTAAGETATVPGVTAFATTTLTPGVYNAASSLNLSGTITLSGNGIFIFQIGSTLTTATGSQIKLIDGAKADHVFWQVGSSATLGASSDFVGTILAHDSITLDTGATVHGGLLAEAGAVTLNDNVITAVPEPAGTSILLAGFAGLIIGAGRLRRHYSDRKLDLRGC